MQKYAPPILALAGFKRVLKKLNIKNYAGTLSLKLIVC
jgi:hypothetical protein